MPDYSYKNRPYEGIEPANVHNIIANAKTLANMLPSQYANEANRLNEIYNRFNDDDAVANLFMDPRNPQVTQAIKEISEITNSVLPGIDRDKYPLQTLNLRYLNIQADMFNENIDPTKFANSHGGPGVIGYGATRSVTMDISTADWPQNEPEKQQFLDVVNAELENTPLLENTSAGLDYMENMLAHIKTAKALKEDPENEQLKKDLADADRKIAESTQFLANHLPEVSQFGTEPGFSAQNINTAQQNFKYLNNNTTVINNIRQGRDLFHSKYGAPYMNALLQTGMGVMEAAEASRGIETLHTVALNINNSFNSAKPLNEEAAQRFPDTFERIMAPLQPENLAGTLTYLKENGLTLDDYLNVAKRELSGAFKEAYSVNENGQMVYKDPGPQNPFINEIITELEKSPEVPKAAQILPPDDPMFVRFMDAGYSLGDAKSACNELKSEKAPAQPGGALVEQNALRKKLDFIKNLDQDVRAGMQQEAAPNQAAAKEFLDLHYALTMPLMDENLPDTMRRLKEQGITLDNYLEAAGEKLADSFKKAYTPPANENDLLIPVYQEPQNAALKNTIRQLDEMEGTIKADQFLSETYAAIPLDPEQGTYKAFEEPISNLQNDPLSSLFGISSSRKDGGLGAYIPDLSPQTEKKLKSINEKLGQVMFLGAKNINGKKSADPEKIKELRPELTELNSILKKEYKKVKEAGNNPIAEINLRHAMQCADCMLNGISYEDLDNRHDLAHNCSVRPFVADLQHSIWSSKDSKHTYKEVTNALKNTTLYDNAVASLDTMDCMINEEKARRKLARKTNPKDKKTARNELQAAAEKTAASTEKFLDKFNDFREFSQHRSNIPECLKGTNLEQNLFMSGSKGRSDQQAAQTLNNIRYFTSQGVPYADAERICSTFQRLDEKDNMLNMALENAMNSIPEAVKLKNKIRMYEAQLNPRHIRDTWENVRAAGIDFEDYLTAMSNSLSSDCKALADKIQAKNEQDKNIVAVGNTLRKIEKSWKMEAAGAAAAEYVSEEDARLSHLLTMDVSNRLESFRDKNIGDFLYNQELVKSYHWYGGRFRNDSTEHTKLTKTVDDLAEILGAKGSDMFKPGIINDVSNDKKVVKLRRLFKDLRDNGNAYLKKNGEADTKKTDMGANRSRAARYYVELANKALSELDRYTDADEILFKDKSKNNLAENKTDTKSVVNDISIENLEDKINGNNKKTKKKDKIQGPEKNSGPDHYASNMVSESRGQVR